MTYPLVLIQIQVRPQGNASPRRAHYGVPAPDRKPGNRTIEEDLYGMSNVEHEPQTPVAAAPGVGTPGGNAEPRPRVATYDEEQMDPQEYARLLDLYDNSFRHIAEGEVVKGTVL